MHAAPILTKSHMLLQSSCGPSAYKFPPENLGRSTGRATGLPLGPHTDVVTGVAVGVEVGRGISHVPRGSQEVVTARFTKQYIYGQGLHVSIGPSSIGLMRSRSLNAIASPDGASRARSYELSWFADV